MQIMDGFDRGILGLFGSCGWQFAIYMSQYQVYFKQVMCMTGSGRGELVILGQIKNIM